MEFYQATINDFAVGLELKMFNAEVGQYGFYKIKPTDCPAEIDWPTCEIKNLNQKDIESIGWNCSTTNGICTFYKASIEWYQTPIPGMIDKTYWDLKLSHDRNAQVVKIRAHTYGEWFTVFEGICRNKIELQNIMKRQLGIKI